MTASRGGSALPEERYTGSEGEAEPHAIPGCSYRHSERESFGRRKQEYNKKNKDDDNQGTFFPFFTFL